MSKPGGKRRSDFSGEPEWERYCEQKAREIRDVCTAQTVSRLARSRFDPEALSSAANMGAAKALRSYAIDGPMTIESWLFTKINYALLEEIRNQDCCSRRTREKARVIVDQGKAEPEWAKPPISLDQPIDGNQTTLAESIADPAPGPEETVLRRSFVETALALLPPLQRRCLYLEYWMGYTRKEIAERTGMETAAVIYQGRKARETLRRHLREELVGR